MKLRLKDVIVIAIVMVATFPVLYLGMLFFTGSARIEFGEKKEDESQKDKLKLIKQSARKDSLAARNSRTFQALQQERVELENERARLREQQDRLDLLQSEIETERRKLVEEREKLEKVVNVSDSLSGKKIKDVAKMYAAMKPSEAAAILGTMNDKMVAKILKSISDDRQKAKIMSLFSREKAARISRIIGGRS